MKFLLQSLFHQRNYSLGSKAKSQNYIRDFKLTQFLMKAAMDKLEIIVFKIRKR